MMKIMNKKFPAKKFKMLLITTSTAMFFIIFFACDNTLELTDPSGDQFSVYGVLDMNKNLNIIRIKDLKVPIEAMGKEPLDAVVVLENITTGNTEVLRDSVVVFDGVPTYNFYTEMEITPESEFLLTITRQNGEMTTATALSPNLLEFDIDEYMPGCRTEVVVTVSPIEIGNIISRISFLFEGDQRGTRVFESNERTQVIHEFKPQQILDEVWKDWALGGIDCYVLCYEDPRPQCWQLDSDIWKLEYEHFGPELLANDSLDEKNIRDGTGKFGIMRTGKFSFPVDSTRIIPARPLPQPYCMLGCPEM